MPSLMASLGLDATNFNDNAEKVIAKTDQVSRKIEQAGSKRIDFNRGTGLANDPTTMFAENKAHEQKERMRAAEKAAAAREIDDLRRLGRAGAEAKALGAKEGRNAAAYSREVIKEEAEALGIGAKNMSALGGAAKMFGGVLTVDFLLRQTQHVIDYASHIGALSSRLNSSTTDLQAWDRVLKQNGSSLQDVEPALEKFNRSRILALQGSTKQQQAASVLGLNEKDLRGLGTTELVSKAGGAFASGKSKEEVIAALETMGGEGASKLIEAFESGFQADVAKVKESGEVMSNTTIVKLKMIGDEWAGMMSKIMAAFGPVVAYLGSLETTKVGKIFHFFEGAAQVAEGIKEGGLTGIKDGLSKGLGTGIKGALTGGFTGGKDALRKYAERLKEEEDDRKKKLEEAGKPFQPSPPPKIETIDLKKKREDDALTKQAKHEADREAAENARLGKHSVSSLQQMGGFLGNFALAAGPEVSAMNAQVRSEEHLREIKEILKKKKAGADLNEDDVSY